MKGNDVSARAYHKGNHCTLTHVLIKNCGLAHFLLETFTFLLKKICFYTVSLFNLNTFLLICLYSQIHTQFKRKEKSKSGNKCVGEKGSRIAVK